MDHRVENGKNSRCFSNITMAMSISLSSIWMFFLVYSKILWIVGAKMIALHTFFSKCQSGKNLPASSLLLFMMVVISQFTNLNYADDLDPVLRQKADCALLGLDDTIMRINSGICRIRGKTINGHETIEDDIYLLFDSNANNYRFENGDLKRVLLNKDYYYEVWAPADPDGRSIRRSSSSDYKTTSMGCRIVDPQDIFRYVPVGQIRPFEYRESIFHTQNREIEKIGYEEVSSHVVKVTTIEPPGDAKWKFLYEYYIDTQRGYTVNHIDMTALGLTGYSIHHERDITWKNINNTWVPSTYTFRSYHTGIDPDKAHICVDWKIEWENVNEKIDSSLFELETMLADLDGYAATFTNELGSSPVLLGVHEVDDSFQNPKTQSAEKSWFRTVFLSVGIILIVIGLCRRFIISKRTKMSVDSGDQPPLS